MRYLGRVLLLGSLLFPTVQCNNPSRYEWQQQEIHELRARVTNIEGVVNELLEERRERRELQEYWERHPSEWNKKQIED